MSLAMSVAALRAKLELSQEEFAHLIGAASATVSRWENERMLPTGLHDLVLRRLEEALDKHPIETVVERLREARSDDARVTALLDLCRAA